MTLCIDIITYYNPFARWAKLCATLRLIVPHSTCARLCQVLQHCMYNMNSMRPRKRPPAISSLTYIMLFIMLYIMLFSPNVVLTFIDRHKFVCPHGTWARLCRVLQHCVYTHSDVHTFCCTHIRVLARPRKVRYSLSSQTYVILWLGLISFWHSLGSTW